MTLSLATLFFITQTKEHVTTFYTAYAGIVLTSLLGGLHDETSE